MKADDPLWRPLNGTADRKTLERNRDETQNTAKQTTTPRSRHSNCDLRFSYLVHCEVSVVEVAAASLEADFSHSVVNQKKIPQLKNIHSHSSSSRVAD